MPIIAVFTTAHAHQLDFPITSFDIESICRYIFRNSFDNLTFAAFKFPAELAEEQPLLELVQPLIPYDVFDSHYNIVSVFSTQVASSAFVTD
ncbi:hypothetical protein TGAM01_v204540 [Trichoderma gamsii]|uniref:Uncharacterized protein n=1 Tax=Trichoderma gamsii TaxID=398673 RepID=A0A2P4ZQF5_9HYPO|nr:hypothetical protein TGAM01_v204540 [Trichoderma gamsii]PON26530.1 hypothetical protein TGAM01_v204540 [Trichoderma gamsii]